MTIIFGIVYFWVVLFFLPNVVMSTYYVVRYDTLTLRGFWHILKTSFIWGPVVTMFIIGEYVAHFKGYEHFIARSMTPNNGIEDITVNNKD